MTAHLSIDKSVYCSVWNEGQSGRSGNDIASALIKVLECVIDTHPEIKNVILWSDSCVPQNRNRVMSTAIMDFLKRHPEVETITQKFSESGHACVQDVDAAHSSIYISKKTTELFSPLRVVRMLKSVRRRNPLKIIQM